MEAANGLFAEDDEQAGNFAFAEGPFEAPVGPRAHLACLSRTGYEPAVRAWLDAFARHLEAAGLSGKVVANTSRGDLSAWEVTKRIPLSRLTTFVAYSLVDRSRSMIDQSRWNVDEPTTATVTALVHAAAYPVATTRTVLRRLTHTTTTSAARACTIPSCPGGVSMITVP